MPVVGVGTAAGVRPPCTDETTVVEVFLPPQYCRRFTGLSTSQKRNVAKWNKTEYY